MSAYFHVPPAAPPASPPLVARGDGEPRRTRLPSLPASLVPSPPASPAPAHASILIFPVPSSAPPSPAPSTPPSHASLPVSSPLSLPISLVSSRHHPHSRGHHHPSLADDPEWISLARDQAVQRTRMAFEPWMETEPSSPGVDLWSWSGGDSRASANPSASMTPASRSSLVLHDETPSEQWEGDTQYEDALSQLQFSTISASTTHPSESQFIFDSLLFPTFNSPTPQPQDSLASAAQKKQTFHLPFESILRLIFSLDPDTLLLLKRPSLRRPPHPDFESILFPESRCDADTAAALDQHATRAEKCEIARRDPSRLLSRGLNAPDAGPGFGIGSSADTNTDNSDSLRKGLSASATMEDVNPFLVGAQIPIYLLTAIPRFLGWKSS